MNKRLELCFDCHERVARGLYLLKSHSVYLDEDLGEHCMCDECDERLSRTLGPTWPIARGWELSHTNTMPA